MNVVHGPNLPAMTKAKSPTSRPLGSARHDISVNLRRLRQERGLSQEGMAELAGFHRTYVSQLERCITNISIDGLERIAVALEVDIRDLLTPE